MSLWGNTDNANNSPFWGASLVNRPANTANRTALYGNTTMGAFVAGAVVATEGVTAVEVANSSIDADKATHAGWNLKKVGTGSLATLVISAGGTGYSNTNTIRVAATGTGSVNATATLTTNSTGGITSVTITNPGAGFIAVNPTVTIANSTGGTTGIGTGATLVATAGGRAGRVSYETLVAMGSIS